MAAGKTHDIINLLVLPVAVYYLQPENLYGFLAGYLIGTFFLSPDNDIYHSSPNKRWKFLKFIWKPYTKIFSHRGVSHVPVLGSITKLLYLLTILIMVLALLFPIIKLIKPDIVKNLNFSYVDLKNYLIHPLSISFLIGLILSEIIHVITDVIYSALKKIKRLI